MKALKVSKYHILGSVSAIRIYYLIFVLSISFIAITAYSSGGNVSSSGLEMASVIFLFVNGLNSFKGNFKFSQANNVSRKTFFAGLFLGVFPITLSMSIIDLIINRIYNKFVSSPTFFDMVYGTFRSARMHGGSIINSGWVQTNEISTLIGTVTWQFALYTMVFFAGILISLIYYRSNKLLKVVISIFPVILLSLSNTIRNLLPKSVIKFIIDIAEFLYVAFGLDNRNSYLATLSLITIGLIFAGCAYLLTRRAIVKE